MKTSLRILPVIYCLSLFSIFACSSFENRRPTQESDTKQLLEKKILEAYLSDDRVKIILGNKSNQKLAPQITTSEIVGDHYRAIVQTGLTLSSGKIDYNYFPNLLRAYQITQNENDKVTDVTTAALPQTKIWAQFRVSQGGIAANWIAPDKKNPLRLKAGKIRDLPILYNVPVSNPEVVDVYFPILKEGLRVKLRIAILGNHPGNVVKFSTSATSELNISVGNSMDKEECDGPFAFGLKGGGKTGWCPWNQTFIATASELTPGLDISKIKSANQLFSPWQ